MFAKGVYTRHGDETTGMKGVIYQRSLGHISLLCIVTI